MNTTSFIKITAEKYNAEMGLVKPIHGVLFLVKVFASGRKVG